MSGQYRSPRLLEPSNALDEFTCRSNEQTEWLHRHARQANTSGTARVFVVTEPASTIVVAYYAWSMASIATADAPARPRKGAGRYPQPAALLARLGVSIEHEGRGLGAALLTDVISRAAQLGQEIGCRGLLVHAEDTDAVAFYRHLVPEFEMSPTDDSQLMLLMKDIVRMLGS